MLPEQFLNRMEKQLGNAYMAFLSCYDEEEYHGLRLNSLKQDVDLIKNSCHKYLGDVDTENTIPWDPYGYYYDNELRPGKDVLHDIGAYYIQEPSAMLPVNLLDVKAGQRVLDMCAAPGGKSTQIAGRLMGKGMLVSNEIHPSRAKILSENIERLGVQNAIVMNETPDKIGELFTDYFDRVIVDAPCSGEGMFRKNDEAGSEWSPENVAMCASRQDDILNSIASCIKMGGVMVYSTCTFAEDENEGTMRRFLLSHPDYKLLAMVRLFPHLINGEGHFAAVLVRSEEINASKQAEVETFIPGNNEELAKWVKEVNKLTESYTYEQEYMGHSSNPLLKSLKDKQIKEFTDFAKESGINLDKLPVYNEGKGVFHMFGDNLYLAPEGTISFKGVKVVRPGLCLGSSEKGRFKPSHSLAMAMTRDIASNYYDTDDEELILNYLKGMTFPCDGKGWQLVAYKGISAGFGKAAGGIMKNHYPKGLRR